MPKVSKVDAKIELLQCAMLQGLCQFSAACLLAPVALYVGIRLAVSLAVMEIICC